MSGWLQPADETSAPLQPIENFPSVLLGNLTSIQEYPDNTVTRFTCNVSGNVLPQEVTDIAVTELVFLPRIENGYDKTKLSIQLQTLVPPDDMIALMCVGLMDGIVYSAPQGTTFPPPDPNPDPSPYQLNEFVPLQFTVSWNQTVVDSLTAAFESALASGPDFYTHKSQIQALMASQNGFSGNLFTYNGGTWPTAPVQLTDPGAGATNSTKFDDSNYWGSRAFTFSGTDAPQDPSATNITGMCLTGAPAIAGPNWLHTIASNLHYGYDFVKVSNYDPATTTVKSGDILPSDPSNVWDMVFALVYNGIEVLAATTFKVGMGWVVAGNNTTWLNTGTQWTKQETGGAQISGWISNMDSHIRGVDVTVNELPIPAMNPRDGVIVGRRQRRRAGIMPYAVAKRKFMGPGDPIVYVPDASSIIQVSSSILEPTYLTTDPTLQVMAVVFTDDVTAKQIIPIASPNVEWKPLQNQNIDKIDIILEDATGEEHPVLRLMNGRMDVFVRVKFRTDHRRLRAPASSSKNL